MQKSPYFEQSRLSGVTSAITSLFRRPAPVYLLLLVYSVVLLSLLDYQSLWLDEIIQILGTRSGTLEHTEQLTRTGTGGVPLGWLPQVLSFRLFGYSPATARLPSALAAIGSCLAVFLTAKQLGLRYPVLPAILLSVLPLHFRYALEGRPYAQGVFLTALSTLLFIRFVKYQSGRAGVAYLIILVLSMYSQPFTCFTPCAHFVWTLLAARRQKRLIYFTGVALTFMVLSFLPWYVYASPLWQQALQSGGIQFHMTWKTPLMLIREITGAGYGGSVALLLLAAVGFQIAA